MRAPALPGWLRRSGLLDVWQRPTLIERTSPLDPAGYAFWTDLLGFHAARAAELDLPAADRDCWARLRDPAEVARYLDDPDCCLTNANILAVGTVPTGTEAAA